jgi:hypothetical protein
MRRNNNLAGLGEKIARGLATKSEVYIIHPAELRALRSVTDEELRSLAARNGWRVVRRLGGKQIEFYNDAGARAPGPPAPIRPRQRWYRSTSADAPLQVDADN